MGLIDLMASAVFIRIIYMYIYIDSKPFQLRGGTQNEHCTMVAYFRFTLWQ